MASSKASILVSAMSSDGAHHQAFIEWAQDAKGVKLCGVEPASFPGAGIGIVANRRITAGEAIVSVPASSLVTVDPDAGQSQGQGDLSVHGRLALSLLEASKALDKTVALELWMKAMPTRGDVFSGMPIKWPPSLQNLLPCEAKALLEKQKMTFGRDCKAFQSMHDTQVHTVLETARQDADEAYEHAWLLVNSRSFYWDYPKAGGSASSHRRRRGNAARKRPRNDCVALCPFIDYFNHVSGSACAQVEYNIHGFTVRSDRDYAAGEEVNVSYGAHSNDFLMVEYGFVMSEPRNESDWTMLDEFILPLLNEEQKQRLQENELMGKYVLDLDGTVCHRTQCALRSLLLPLRKWERFVGGLDDGEKEQDKVDELLKSKVLKEYAGQVDGMLQKLDGLEKSYARDMLMTRWRQIEEMLRRTQSQG